MVKGLCSTHALQAAFEPLSGPCHTEAQCCYQQFIQLSSELKGILNIKSISHDSLSLPGCTLSMYGIQQ